MNYFQLFLSQVIMLIVGIAAEFSPSLGAILASAPTGTPLALWLGTEGKIGINKYKHHPELSFPAKDALVVSEMLNKKLSYIIRKLI